MKPLAALQTVAADNGIESSVTDVMAQVAQLFASGFGDIEAMLDRAAVDAPTPVDDVLAYMQDAGGKRIRPALCLLSARAVSSEAPLPVALATVCELLHSASLLHDDVIDEGDMRRGVPAARKVWTNALSILSGDYALMKCLEIMADFPKAYLQLLVSTLRELVEGEIVQLGLRNSMQATEADYFAIVNGKTSSLFHFAALVGAMSAGAHAETYQALGTFGRHLGTAFQLIDDVLDFDSQPQNLGKDLLADISQGKMTLPVILAAERASEMQALLTQLTMTADVVDVAQQISQTVRRSGALSDVRARAAAISQQAVEALGVLPAERAPLVRLMTQMADALLTRRR